MIGEAHKLNAKTKWWQQPGVKSIVWRYPPGPSNIVFLVRDPDNKPLFATVRGWGLDPIYIP